MNKKQYETINIARKRTKAEESGSSKRKEASKKKIPKLINIEEPRKKRQESSVEEGEIIHGWTSFD